MYNFIIVVSMTDLYMIFLGFDYPLLSCLYPVFVVVLCARARASYHTIIRGRLTLSLDFYLSPLLSYRVNFGEPPWGNEKPSSIRYVINRPSCLGRSEHSRHTKKPCHMVAQPALHVDGLNAQPFPFDYFNNTGRLSTLIMIFFHACALF